MSRSEEIQSVIRQYRDATGETDVDMNLVVQFAVQMGWPLPQPVDPLDILAREFSRAAREEVKRDEVTGLEYRVNHIIPAPDGQGRLWIVLDQSTRPKAHRSLLNRREQIVNDLFRASNDTDRWNRIHPDEEPIQFLLDFTDDVEWRKNAPD